MKKPLITLAALTALGLGNHALAADHEVKMLNNGADGMMVFEPAYLQVAPGDTVTFVPTDPAHNSHSVYAPEGAKGWAGAMNEPVSVTLDVPGTYLYQCDPHLPLGMVGVVKVGEAKDLAAARQAAETLKQSIAVNKERVDQYLNQVQ